MQCQVCGKRYTFLICFFVIPILSSVANSCFRVFTLTTIVTTGLIIANSLGNWHDPEKVNTYFQSFGFKVTAFSNDDIRDLKVLWQLRHSIVHNGATITKADAQKVEELKTFGNRKIILSNKFIYDLSKSMHSMVFNVNSRLKHAFLMNMLATVTQDERDQVEKIFEVTSRNSFWLR